MASLGKGVDFGPYRIEGFIAGGGMGEVYGAMHAVYQQPVAIKVLHSHLHADDSWRARFNEEGLVGTQLKHPNILSARELVEHEQRIALVMDLVQGGQTLLTIVDRDFTTGLSLEQALQVFLKVVSGLEYLHGKGIIHGDIKPENVLISGKVREPKTWIPRLTDFGTVALISDPVLIDGRPAVVATPRYASPEHMLGVDKIHAQSDIYCLGLLLHFLLTGRHASAATSVPEAAEIVREPLSVMNLIDQPESVLDLFRRCTLVEADERFASCDALGMAVRDVLDSLGIKLQLDDIQADLATELMEEQAEKQRENLQRGDGLGPMPDVDDEPSSAGQGALQDTAPEPASKPLAQQAPEMHHEPSKGATVRFYTWLALLGVIVVGTLLAILSIWSN